MDAAIRFFYKMPKGKAISRMKAKQAVMATAEKALERTKHLTRAGKSEAEIETELAKEFSPDALLDASIVLAEFVCEHIVDIHEAELEDFHEKGERADFSPAEFDFELDSDEEIPEGFEIDGDGLIWKKWPQMNAVERVEEIINRQMLFTQIAMHLTAGFGAITVGKSALRQLTEDAKTTD